MSSSNARRGRNIMILGAVVALGAAAMFAYATTIDLPPASGMADGEPLRRIGQVAGGIGGLGTVAIIIGAVIRARET